MLSRKTLPLARYVGLYSLVPFLPIYRDVGTSPSLSFVVVFHVPGARNMTEN